MLNILIAKEMIYNVSCHFSILIFNMLLFCTNKV